MSQTTITAAAVFDRAEPRRSAKLIRLARAHSGAMRRFLVIAAIAWWLGGFTFYAGIAIPMGVEVLGTHRAVGFITQRVTQWLNVGGVIALSILLWNLALTWRAHRGKLLHYTMLVTWLLMAAIEVELISLHPVMDRLLTIHPVRQILDEDRFDLLHHVYLISTTVQWTLGVIHVWCICAAWQAESWHGFASRPASAHGLQTRATGTQPESFPSSASAAAS